MQRFKQGDPVFILPKYAHLYPGLSAVVIGAVLDPFRPMFNEYTLQFADRSTEKIFEFQIIEGIPAYQTVVASWPLIVGNSPIRRTLVARLLIGNWFFEHPHLMWT